MKHCNNCSKCCELIMLDGVTRWDVDFMGSKNLTDVQRCRRQKFLLKITKKDV